MKLNIANAVNCSGRRMHSRSVSNARGFITAFQVFEARSGHLNMPFVVSVSQTIML